MYAIPCEKCNLTFMFPKYPDASSYFQKHVMEAHGIAIIELPTPPTPSAA
jgi:hypothetical protein